LMTRHQSSDHPPRWSREQSKHRTTGLLCIVCAWRHAPSSVKVKDSNTYTPTLPRTFIVSLINPLQLNGSLMHHEIQRSETLHCAHRAHLCVLYRTRNQKLSFPYTASNDRFLCPRSVFTARYELNLDI
jgi:hypothetical protein